MDQTMGLHVDITADVQQAQTEITDIEGRLAKLEQQFHKTSGAGGASGFAKALEDIGNHGRTVGIALDAIGADAAGAAAKFSSLTQLFSKIGSAAPELMAIGAAAAVAFASFAEARAAADAASEWQQRLAILGQTVRDQGGDWRTLSSSVQDWADLQERTTQFSRSDAVDALTRLTATGMGLADAMIVTRVAEDAAAATGRSLTDVNFALSEAMHGRTQALTQLGLGTKESIHDGMTFSQVLQEIEDHMGGAAAASADTYAGKMAQLHNAFQSLQETLGGAFLPMLTALVSGIAAMVETARQRFSDMVAATRDWMEQHQKLVGFVVTLFRGLSVDVRDAVDGIITIFKLGWDAAMAVFDTFADLLEGDTRQLHKDLGGLWGDALNAIESDFGAWGDNVVTIAKAIGSHLIDVFSGIGHAMSDAMTGNFRGISGDLSSMMNSVLAGVHLRPMKTLGQAFSGDAWSQLFSGVRGSSSNPANIGDLSSGLGDSMVGGALGGGTGYVPPASSGSGAASGRSSPDVEYFSKQSQALAQYQSQLAVALDNTTRSIKLQAPQIGYAAAEQEIANAKMTEAVQWEQKLQTVIAEDTSLQSEHREAVASTAATLAEARQHMEEYAQSLTGAHKLTLAEKEEQKNLAAAVREATAAHTAAVAAYNASTAALKAHNEQLDHARATIAALNATAPDADASLSFAKFLQDEQQRMADDLATWQMTNAQKVAYYKQALEQLSTADVDYWNKRQQLQQAYDSALVDALKDEVKAQQQVYKEWTDEAQQWSDKTAGLVDALFEHSKKKTNEFLKTWKSFIKEAEEAFLKSALFEIFFAGFSGGKGPQPSFLNSFLANLGVAPKNTEDPARRGGALPAGALAGLMALNPMHAGAAPLTMPSISQGLGGAPAVQAGIAGATSGGIIGALVGVAAATQIAASLPTDSVMSLLFGVGAPSSATSLSNLVSGGASSPTSTTGGVSSVAGAAAALTGAGTSSTSSLIGYGSDALGAAGGIGGVSSGLGTSFLGGAPIGSVLAGAGVGYVAGGALDNLFYGGKTKEGASIGGAIGGIAGALTTTSMGIPLLAAGPLGWAAYAAMILGGAAIGGLFGDHFNPANEPDIYNTSAFGQAVANLGGYGTGSSSAVGTKKAYNANGSPFTESSKMASLMEGITGGTNASGIAGIEEYLAQYALPNGQPGPNTPSWLLQPAKNGSKNTLWQALVNNFGISATGSGKLNFGTDIGDEWISGASDTKANAKNQTTYTNLNDLLDQFAEDYETQGSIGVGSPSTGPIYSNDPTNPGGGSWFGSPFTAAYEVDSAGGALQSSSLSGMPTLNVLPGTPGSGTTTAAATTPAAAPGTTPGTVGVIGGPTEPIMQPEGGGAQTAMAPPQGVAPITGAPIHLTIQVQGSVTSEDELLTKLQSSLAEQLTRLMGQRNAAPVGVAIP